MTKKILNINLDNKIRFDIFSQAEENLYIDMLIKTDEKMREKANKYAGYLKTLKEYIEFENEKEVDEIIDFLESKSDISEVSLEEKRKYMEMKFDVLDVLDEKIKRNKSSINKNSTYSSQDFYTLDNEKLSQNIEKFNEQLELYFPVIGTNEAFLKILERDDSEYNKYDFIAGHEEKKSDEKIEEKNGKLHYSGTNKLENFIINFNYNNPIIKNIADLKDTKYILVPFLIPRIIENQNEENPYIKWEFKILKIKSVKKDEKEEVLDFISQLICLKNYNDEFKKFKDILMDKFFSKINRYCDYRYFDRSFFK